MNFLKFQNGKKKKLNNSCVLLYIIGLLYSKFLCYYNAKIPFFGRIVRIIGEPPVIKGSPFLFLEFLETEKNKELIHTTLFVFTGTINKVGKIA